MKFLTLLRKLRKKRKLQRKKEIEEGVEKKVEREKPEKVERVTEEKKVVVEEVEGIEIPPFVPTAVKPVRRSAEEEGHITLTYPLIPKNPRKGEPIFAYARIYWDPKLNRYVYQLVEPPLTPKLKEIMKKIRETLERRLDVDFSKLKIHEAKEYLKKQIEDILEYYELSLHETEKRILQYYVERDFMGLGKIEPLMRDENIEDISCDGVGVPIFVFHRDPRLGSLMTNVKFDDKEELDSFVIRLSQLCGKSISVANPLLSGSLPDGSRVQATLGTDIARRGSNFTIRRFTEKPLTPIHLLEYGTLDLKMLAYLWFVVDYGRSVLVSGGTASGKTTMLNVLSLFIRPEKKIVSIEDTPELQLPHPHWVPQVARTPIGEVGKGVGEVDLFDLLKESLRQRPDYIIVGEVRGKEAYVLFQQMATGHPSLATIHAENMEKLIDRLITPPISLPPSLVASVDVVVFMATTRYKERQVRRVVEIVEIVGFDREKNLPETNVVFKWDPMTDTFTGGKSVVLKKIGKMKGMTEEEVKDELERRMFVLNWMKTHGISDYREVATILNAYYTSPERLLERIKIGEG